MDLLILEYNVQKLESNIQFVKWNIQNVFNFLFAGTFVHKWLKTLLYINLISKWIRFLSMNDVLESSIWWINFNVKNFKVKKSMRENGQYFYLKRCKT